MTRKGSMSSSSIHPWDEAVAAAIDSEWVKAGFTKSDGTRDRSKFRSTILDFIMKAKVLRKEDKLKKSITKGDLTKAVFPGMATPEDIDQDDLLAISVWKKIVAEVWGETKTDAGSILQRMIGVHMGNGYVMCRTKIGTDKVDAVYVTDNYALIKADNIRPENASLQRKATSAVRNREMIMVRHPDKAKDILNEYVRTLQAALDSGKAQLQLMEASVSNNGKDEDGNNEEDQD